MLLHNFTMLFNPVMFHSPVLPVAVAFHLLFSCNLLFTTNFAFMLHNSACYAFSIYIKIHMSSVKSDFHRIVQPIETFID